MAFLMALVVWVLTVASLFLLKQGAGAMPETISEAARSIDGQFFLTLTVTGIAFVAAQGLLGFVVFRFTDKQKGPASYLHGNNLIEFGGAAVCLVVFMTLGLMGQRVWAGLHLSGSDPNAMHIEVLGQQFAWNIRYKGPDQTWGRSSFELYDDSQNPSGIDLTDPHGNDDVVSLNNLVVPVNTPIELNLRSKDVLHSFFMPSLRIKQDLVPGLEIPLRFTAEQVGEYEIACAELCGLGHYRMSGRLRVLPQNEFDAWLAEQVSEIDR